MPNAKLTKLRRAIEASTRLRALWVCSNVTAINRLGINDHGPVHVRIVMRLGLRLLRLLMEAGVRPGVLDHGLAPEDAEVVVTLSAALHDIGHAVHREEHENLSLVLGAELADALLTGIYEEPAKTQVLADVLHAVYAHRVEARPLTLEAGVLKVADALDMEKGRARIPFQVGRPTIHSVSALAIDKVEIRKGEEKPVHVHVRMTNSAGIFQLDSLFREKLLTSGLQEYIELSAEVTGEEKKIIARYALGERS